MTDTGCDSKSGSIGYSVMFVEKFTNAEDVCPEEMSYFAIGSLALTSFLVKCNFRS